MDGWIGLSGSGKWMDVESGKWIVARFRISHTNKKSTTGHNGHGLSNEPKLVCLGNCR